LRDEGGERQIEPPSEPFYACSLELEGFGTKGYVYIFGREPR